MGGELCEKALPCGERGLKRRILPAVFGICKVGGELVAAPAQGEPPALEGAGLVREAGDVPHVHAASLAHLAGVEQEKTLQGRGLRL